MQYTLAALAAHVGAELLGDPSLTITGIAGIDDALPGDIVFAENSRFLTSALRSQASAVVAPLGTQPGGKPLLLCENPRQAFTLLLSLFQEPDTEPRSVHPSAVVAPSAVLGDNVRIGPCAVIGEGCILGSGVSIGANTVLGSRCTLGEHTVLHANVTLYSRCRLGSRVIVHSGAVLGADGFGYIRIGNAMHKVPQLGDVEIGDDVEIGANTTIDRAKTGTTFIGARTKIDNQVQIAHNCRIGEDCIIVSQVGLAGGVKLGRGVVLAGQVGVKDQVTIGDGVMAVGAAGIWKDVPAGEIVSGNPARSHREKLRLDAALNRLPDALKRLKELERRL
jgi:UDP-3-O-[3-hydroxymyristoyl] glucosamine N-acyltransferase